MMMVTMTVVKMIMTRMGLKMRRRRVGMGKVIMGTMETMGTETVGTGVMKMMLGMVAMFLLVWGSANLRGLQGFVNLSDT